MSLSSINRTMSSSNNNQGFEAIEYLTAAIAIETLELRQELGNIEASNELMMENSADVLDELKKLNETSSDILQALSSNLDDLEARLEVKRSAAAGSFLPTDAVTTKALDTGANSGLALGGLIGDAVGLSRLTGNRLNFLKGLKTVGPTAGGRTLLGAIGVYASMELGDFIEELTGSETAGDTVSILGSSISIGATLGGPAGALIGAIAGTGIAAYNAMEIWADGKRQEFAENVVSTLEALGAGAGTPAAEFTGAAGVSPGVTTAQAAGAYMQGMTQGERQEFFRLAEAARSGDPVAQEKFTEAMESGYFKLLNEGYLTSAKASMLNAAGILSSGIGNREIDPETFNALIQGLGDFRAGGEAGYSNLSTEYDALSSMIRNTVFQGYSTEELQALGPNEFGVNSTTFDKMIELSREVDKSGGGLTATTPSRVTAGGFLAGEDAAMSVVVVGGGSQSAPAPVINVEQPTPPMGDTIDRRFDMMYKGIPGPGFYGY